MVFQHLKNWTRGSREGRVSLHMVSVVGCLEEVDVKLGMGLSDLCEAGLRTMF